MKANRSVFISACLGMLLFGIGLITLGSVATGLQEKFDLDNISSGTLFSILPVGIITGSLLFGPFSDRYGYKLFLLLSCVCMFTGFQGIAYASSLDLLKVCVFLFGLGGGALNGAANAIVSDISTANKSANLSLLGVFFAIGALGMPVILGLLGKKFSYQVIISLIGHLALGAGMFFALTKFPEPKQTKGIPLAKGLKLMQDNVLLLIAFFLFCQSGFEGIINNWTTTFLSSSLSVPQNYPLFALSLYVGGMAVMRLILGSILRIVPAKKILMVSFVLLLTGCSMLEFFRSYYTSVAGLVAIGAGLAAGFPVMLGLVGNRYAELSATAFSIVLSIALLGNMIMNYLMGIIADAYGIRYITILAYTLSFLMLLLSLTILKRININTYKN